MDIIERWKLIVNCYVWFRQKYLITSGCIFIHIPKLMIMIRHGPMFLLLHVIIYFNISTVQE